MRRRFTADRLPVVRVLIAATVLIATPALASAQDATPAIGDAAASRLVCHQITAFS